jgi:class 3 adenylate cyclase/predicted ATPase
MECPNCDAIVPNGNRFCGQCGTALPLRCRACGSLNPAGAKFCGDCGAGLTSKTTAYPVDRSARALRPTETEAERRHLTVMFCDLVGSTVLATELDPEDLAEVIRKFQAVCVSAVEHVRGHVARFMGDGIVAYFGYPQAYEDDAERAVRAGLDVAAKVSRLLLPSGERLQVRVGIATGLVVVGETLGESSAQEQAAVGITPNLAARLQALADPNTVLIAESTQRLLGNVFVYEAVRPYQLKGFAEPVSAWRVVGERVVDSRFDAQRSGRLTQFVGRQHELQRLLDLWDKTKCGECHVALLCGEAGIGKSRISKMLHDRLSDTPHLRIQYQCSPYHTNSPFYPVINQLEHAAGFEAEDTPKVRLEKLGTMLTLASQATLADIGLYAALLSIPTDGLYEQTDVTPQRQKDLTIDALIRQLLAIAQTRPVLFVLEDVHWIDPTTLELVNRTIRSIKTASVLFLLTFRLDFIPPWLDQPHVTMLRLEKLGRDQAGAMILGVAGGKQIPAEVYEQIIRKTDGVPLFIEELTKAVLESGLLRDAGDRYVIDGPLPPLAIPTTLYDSLMARLDRHAPIKEIAQIGAVLGREFSYRLLAAVVPTSTAFLQAALTQLTAAELIFEHGERPDSIYSFKHALVQDAAYESLLRSKRQQLHKRIADVLKEQFVEITERQPELMAHHLLHAGLIEPAIDYLQKAGQRAIQRSANTEAIGHLKHALELLHSLSRNPERARAELELEVVLGQAMIAGCGYAARETKEVLLRAKGLIDESTPPSQKFAILYGIWACHYVGGEGALLRVAAEDFLAEAERHDDTAALCLSHRTLGTTLVTIGDFVGGRWHLERARALYDPNDHACFRYQYGQDIGAAALSYLCWALWHLGYVEQALEVAAEAVTVAEASAHPHTLVYTICHARGMLDVCRGYTEEMLSYASMVVTLSKEHGFPFWAAGGQIFKGWATICEETADHGMELLHEGLSAWQTTGARLWLPIFLALKAQAFAKQGRINAALQTIEQAIVISNETSERWAIAEVLRLKAGFLIAAGRARSDEIEALFVESLEIARRQKAHSWELRTATDLARLWREEGRCNEAIKVLQASYLEFTEGLQTPDVKCARALLDQLIRLKERAT